MIRYTATSIPPQLNQIPLTTPIIPRDTTTILHSDTVQSMILRASRLSPRSRQMLADIIDAMLQAEGKDL